ncbi:rho GDP-dissociation inhibitor 1 isoform X2 [Dermochelys coriacea]|uniref:rho GDP-dissociation inhibitor 1 isoform X2 n=1 Tax=Dermochelys coriacea TaxID=27794 RepID=UPI001CA7EC5D|nr:rho GDP-dissociation inhibitor 1 isoform X2 [Dermochelys coriacea]
MSKSHFSSFLGGQCVWDSLFPHWALCTLLWKPKELMQELGRGRTRHIERDTSPACNLALHIPIAPVSGTEPTPNATHSTVPRESEQTSPFSVGDLESYKKQSFVLKEGVEYRIKISFRVNKEIVSGLKYIQHTFRKGVKIDKTDYMVGSYGPRAEEYEFLTPMEEAPKGMLARGSYNIKSKFTDDDKTDHLSWEWNLTIKKEWKE